MAAPSRFRPNSYARVSVLVRLAFVLAVLGALVVSASVAGCGSTDDCKPGTVQADNDCGKLCVQKGGLVENGACIAKCDPKDCVANNTCVKNQCQLQCTSYKDCQLGTQDCLPATEDGTGKAIFTCQSSNKAPFGTNCQNGDECDALKSCPNGDSCDYTQCGGSECKKDDASCAGIPDCSLGLCPDGKTACTVPGCPQDQCVSLSCITKGMADALAYCTLEDCTSDSDCPSSYVCGITRDAHDICDGSNMTLKEKGNNGFCGSTDAGDCSGGQSCPSGTYCDAGTQRCTGNCVDPKSFKSNGHSFFEGSVCLLRKTCLERKLCDPCEVDGQCANLPGGACVAIGGEKRCSVGCAKDSDCQPDYKCDANFCQPRFGKCVGDGNFCEPCLSDEDCGDKSTRKACVSGSRNQQACMDLAFPKACTADTDCGKDNGGDHLHCWGGQASPHVYQKLDKATGQLPEGLVVKGTTAYIGYAATGEIVQMDIQKKTKVHFASGPAVNGTTSLMLGLAFNPTTNELYMGVACFDASIQAGIYKVPSTGGVATLVASDPQMIFPNGLAFDSTGNLYVTESANGLIFKVVGGTATAWLDDPSLKANATNCTPNTPFPIGANGIFLSGSGATAAMVVSNTNLAQIVKIPINMDGTPGAAAIIAGPDCSTLGGIDGIVNDTAHAAILGAVNTQNLLIRVPSAGGAVTTAFSGTPLNGPASVALMSVFGQEVVITNSDFSGGSEGPGVLTMINGDNCTSGTQCGVYHTCQDCDSDVDCPASPSGLHGHCYGSTWDGNNAALSVGDFPPDECVPVLYQGQVFCESYKSCGLPIPNISTLQTGCW